MHSRRLLVAALLAIVAFSPWPSPAQTASTTSQVMATVHQFFADFNKGDAKGAIAACAPSTNIVDEFPPHVWQGAGACAMWYRALMAVDKQQGITGGVVGAGTPSHVDVAGDTAYVVLPTTYSYKMRGKPMSETGSTLTAVVQKLANGWRITAWTWSAGKQ